MHYKTEDKVIHMLGVCLPVTFAFKTAVKVFIRGAGPALECSTVFSFFYYQYAICLNR